MRIVLASKSPRRQELMKLITDDFEIITADVNEREIEDRVRSLGASAEEVMKSLAEAKARAVFDTLDDKTDVLVIGSDTSVILDDLILGKPNDKEDAIKMLTALSGRKHQVITGVSVVYDGGDVTFAVISDVLFNDLDDYQKALIARYCDTSEPYDKAGSYGIQGGGALLVKEISGDYFNVVGLPVAKLARVMDELGQTTL